MTQPEKYSYTKIDTFDQCSWKYKLMYEDKHYVFVDTVATEVGTLIHETEEKIGIAIKNNQVINYTELIANVKKTAAELQAKYPKDFITLDKSKRNYVTKISEYIQTGIYRLEQFCKKYPDLEIIGLEQEFNVEFNSSTIFHGFIDRVFRSKTTGDILIQDIKTYPKPIAKADLTNPLQFFIYGIAAKKLYNCPESKLHYQYDLPFCNLSQNVTFTDEVSDNNIKVSLLLRSIRNKDFIPSPTCLCNYCQFCETSPEAPEETKYLCPYYCLWDRETRRKADMFRAKYDWMGIQNHEKILEDFEKNRKK